MQKVVSCALIVWVGCTLEASSGLSVTDGAPQRNGHQWHALADEGANRADPKAYSVILGQKTESTIDFSVSPSWDCGQAIPAPVKVIYVCKTQGDGAEERRTSRCYSIEPSSVDHMTDPYLNCVHTPGASSQCTQRILSNGRYHVGAFYGNDTCGNYEFWWSGVQFSTRDLSASLHPVSESRNLDHRMAPVLAVHDVSGNDRWIPKYTRLRIDYVVESGLPAGVNTIEVAGPGIVSVAYDETLDADAISPPLCESFDHREYPTWSCPVASGLPLVAVVDLRDHTVAMKPFWLEIGLKYYSPAIEPPESSIRFEDIKLHEVVRLPIVLR